MRDRGYIYLAVFLIVLVVIFNAGMMGRYLFIALIAFAAMQLMYSIVLHGRKYQLYKLTSPKEYTLKMTARFMGLFFFTGTILFAFTFPVISEYHRVDFNNAELVVRSMICSLDLFMLDVDSNILDRLDSHAFIKGIIAVQAALSFSSTVALLISLVFSRAKAHYLLNYATKITDQSNHLYLFFGLNRNAKLLATDIRKNDPKSVIVFIDEANVKDDDNDSWSNIVSLFSHRQTTFDLTEGTDALVAIASRQLCDIDPANIKKDPADILSMIGLNKIKQFIQTLAKYSKDSQLHVFFLSDNEDNNIRSLVNLAKDETIRSVAENKEIKDKIYCHARFNGPNRVVEDIAVRKCLNVEIIDSSHIAVELLKLDYMNQPVRVAHISKDVPTTVTEPIRSLIVGFGEVGRDAFRFLYEFGTFMSYDREKEKLNICRPEITATDSQMHKLKGIFVTHLPALKFGTSLDLIGLDYNNVNFWEKLLSEEKCRIINYIVLALGNDDENIALAVNIFNHIRRYREDMSSLIIMVRCIKEEKVELLQKIADHYNRGCDDGKNEVIRIFGNPKYIYSYNTIIRDELTRQGMQFKDNYSRIRNEKETWQERHDRYTGILEHKPGELVVPVIDDLQSLRRKESQDMANALHTATKMWLLEKALGKNYNWSNFILRFFDNNGNSSIVGKFESLYYPSLSVEENIIMHNLAQLEHARWMAAHELLGYSINTIQASCNERKRQHNCLTVWENLDEESVKASCPGYDCDYKSYDYSVVDTSIAILGAKLGKLT